MLTIQAINTLTREQFVEQVGWVFEHSPWVAERAWAKRPFAHLAALHAAMQAEVELGTRGDQLALLRAHPDLGSKARMSTASISEQLGAGLDRLAPQEYESLQKLNTAYRNKFGFPFLYAVKGSTKYDILRALEQRLNETPDREFRQALTQVYRIALFRLQDTIAP